MPELLNIHGAAPNGHAEPMLGRSAMDSGASSGSDDDHIRVVCALTAMSDESQLYTAYPSAGPGKVRLMARAQNIYDIEQTIERYNANVLLIDHQLAAGADAGSALITLIQKLRHRPHSPVVTFGLCYEPSWHKTFEESGALGTISGPITSKSIVELNERLPVAIRKAYHERLQPDYLTKFSDDAIRLIDSGAWQRQVCTFWSTKGGVGKSFLAVNFAVMLGVICDRRTLLIDADMNAGDVATYLGMSPREHNICRLAQIYAANGDRLSPAMIQHQMLPYNGNLSVICGAYDMSLTGFEALRGARGQAFANALMNTLETMNYDFIIFDLGQNFYEPMHFVPLSRSTLNLVVVTSEKSAAIEMELALRRLRDEDQLALDDRRFRLVLNKWDDRMGLDAREVVHRLGLPEFARVPYGESMCVDLSLNLSKPIVLDKPNHVGDAIANAVSAVYRPVQTLWERRGGHAKAKKSGPLSFLKRRNA
jgi:MinD-like ATPase involved in chromosome partitioning or flagellar assembly